MVEDKFKKLIQDNISKFDVDPTVNHEQKFMNKLVLRFKKVIIDITPYIVKVLVIGSLLWCVSFTIWGMFLNPNRNKKPLRKVDLEHRKIEYVYKANEHIQKRKVDVDIKKQLREELKPLKEEYDQLKIELKKDPGNQELINAMVLIYEQRKVVIDSIIVKTKRLEINKE